MKILLSSLFIILSFCVSAQNPNEYISYDSLETFTIEDYKGIDDTLTINTRSFSSKELNELKSDSEFDYKQPATVAESLWNRFIKWLLYLLSTLFSAAASTDLTKVIIYVIAAVVLIFVIMALLKVNAFKVFYSGADSANQNYQVFHENIHEMDFDKLIQESVDNNQFRLATRLVFLYALKLLSDKHLIEFQSGKTNHDYVDELSLQELKPGLSELSYFFDYAWYGNFPVSDKQFQKIKSVFNELQARLK